MPVTPVDNGKPLAFVNTRADGVPRAGVVRVGELARTTLPLPVEPTKEYVPEPVRFIKPVPENPVIASKHEAAGEVHPVPP